MRTQCSGVHSWSAALTVTSTYKNAQYAPSLAPNSISGRIWLLTSIIFWSITSPWEFRGTDREGKGRMTPLLCRGTGLTALQRFVRLPHNSRDWQCLLYILTIIHIICSNYFARNFSYSLSVKQTIQRDSSFQVIQLSNCSGSETDALWQLCRHTHRFLRSRKPS